MTRGHSAGVRNFQVENDGGEETSGWMKQSGLHEHCLGGVVHPMRGRQSLNLKHGLIPTNAETKKKNFFMTIRCPVYVLSFILL